MLLCRKHGTQGRINALVNYAGLRDIVHSPLNLTEEDWNEVLRTNLTRSLLVANSSRKQNLQNVSLEASKVSSVGFSELLVGFGSMQSFFSCFFRTLQLKSMLIVSVKGFPVHREGNIFCLPDYQFILPYLTNALRSLGI